jgi:hypothetical protein
MRVSKRSPGHAPRPRDLWDTPPEAVAPLLPHLAPGTQYIEPCAGNGALISALTAAGHICTLATDLEPQTDDVEQLDALDVVWPADQLIITNPPWTRSVLHRMIDAWPNAWLLYDANWVWTKQARAYLPRCESIVPIGRVRWIPGSKHVGMDDAAWFRFVPHAGAGARIALTQPSRPATPPNHER